MHSFELPAYVREYHISRRGRLFAFHELDPSATALIVIDMQNGFVAPGQPSEVPIAREIVPNINRLAGEVRRTGGTVVWVQHTADPSGPGDWPVFYNEINKPDVGPNYLANFSRGALSHQLWPELDVKPTDVFVSKKRFSAFVNGSSDIAERLAATGVTTVLICGTLTNVCCGTSAVDAMMLGFRVLMVDDANATRGDDAHSATLVNFAQYFGDVRSTDDVVALLNSDASS